MFLLVAHVSVEDTIVFVFALNTKYRLHISPAIIVSSHPRQESQERRELHCCETSTVCTLD